MLINTSLLRERFVLAETGFREDPMIALSNRILLPLNSKNGQMNERLVVRAHSMHMALRMAARLTQEFYNLGPLVNRQVQLDWHQIWNDITTTFERLHVPETWVCVYHHGQIVFQDGDHHPFLDVIEKCDVKNRAEYYNAVKIAEDTFLEKGKVVEIEHDINIAAVIGVMEKQARCGLILRSPKQTTTFNYAMRSVEKDIAPHAALDLAADFMEGIQLAVTAGLTERRRQSGMLSQTSPMVKKMKASHNRIGKLSKAIEAYNNMYDVRYRPEQPDFLSILEEVRDLQGLNG